MDFGKRGGGMGPITFVSKYQLSLSYGSGVMPVRRDTFETPYSIIEEDFETFGGYNFMCSLIEICSYFL